MIIPPIMALSSNRKFWSSKPFVGIRNSKVQQVFTTATEYRRRILAFDTDSGNNGEALLKRLHAELLAGQTKDSAIAMVIARIDQSSSGVAAYDTTSSGMREKAPFRPLSEPHNRLPADIAHVAIQMPESPEDNDAHRPPVSTRRAASLLLGSAGLAATLIGGVIAVHRRNRPST